MLHAVTSKYDTTNHLKKHLNTEKNLSFHLLCFIDIP